MIVSFGFASWITAVASAEYVLVPSYLSDLPLEKLLELSTLPLL